MRFLLAVLGSPLFASALLWATFGACVDEPISPSASVARLVASWDPLACGDPHRVVIELEDDSGATLAASTPCAIGGLTLDVADLGIYRGRIYARAPAAPIRSIMPIELTIDEPLVHWFVATPR